MNDPRWLDLEDFKFLCFDLAQELMSYGEPIPDYDKKDEALLASALGVPRQMFGGEYLYPTLAKQAAALFYSLIKNHPFQNGNKRIAVMGLLSFLGLNRKWLSIDPIELYKLAVYVSNSKPLARDTVLKMSEKAINENIINFPDQDKS